MEKNNYPVTLPVYDNKKNGFATITEVRNFLYGHNNTKHSKVYVRIEQVDGYNALCIYLDNNYKQEDVTPVTDLNEINGFKKFYQLKVNKFEPVPVAEPEYNEFLMETVQDITAVAVQIASEQKDGYDSRELFSECRRWADEFEQMWNTYVEQGVEDEHDYMLEVEEFAEKKVNEYLDIEND